MELELTADQQALAEAVIDFVVAECPMTLVRRVVEKPAGAESADKEVATLWSRMVDLDWPALTVSVEDGGIGLGAVELAVVAEQLGRVLCPAPFLSTASQFVPAIRAAGTPEQRRRFLSPVAVGGLVGTLAVAEASGRVDNDAIVATARATERGWVIDGEKHYVFDAAGAQEIVVVARQPGSAGDEGIGMFVVPRSSVEVTPMNSIDASRPFATVKLNGVEIDADRALGGPGSFGDAVPGESALALKWALQWATTALAAEMVGTSQAIFDVVHSYVGEREQFGVKIGSFQAVKHKLANMFVALESARATAYFAAAAIDEDDERRALATSMAKSSAGDCQKLMATEGIQCLGGIGYTWEHDMHLYVKRQKAQAALFGTANEHRARIASHLGL